MYGKVSLDEFSTAIYLIRLCGSEFHRNANLYIFNISFLRYTVTFEQRRSHDGCTR